MGLYHLHGNSARFKPFVATKIAINDCLKVNTGFGSCMLQIQYLCSCGSDAQEKVDCPLDNEVLPA